MRRPRDMIALPESAPTPAADASETVPLEQYERLHTHYEQLERECQRLRDRVGTLEARLSIAMDSSPGQAVADELLAPPRDRPASASPPIDEGGVIAYRRSKG